MAQPNPSTSDSQSQSDSTANSAPAQNAPQSNSDDMPAWFKKHLEESSKQTQQTPPAQPQQSQGRSTVADEIMTELRGMPEKIAGFLAEKNPKPATPSTQDSSTGPSGAPKEPGNPQGQTRQQRFVKWWGGQ